MTGLDIRINIKKLTDSSTFLDDRIKKRTLLLMIKSFADYVSELYLHLIEEAIHSRRYKGRWEPLEEEGYLEYLGVSPTVGILSLMKDAIEVKKIGYNYVIRFSPYYLYPDTRIPLVRVIKAIEKGTSEFNARPIVLKQNVLIRTHIRELWKGYLAMKGVIGE